MSGDARLDRAQGCLLGQFAGDSLGGLVEFRSPEQIRQRYPDGCRELHAGGNWGLIPGQPTDDSELALMLARSLVGRPAYDAAAALAAYRHWYASGPFDVGFTVSAALRAGRPNADSQSNGSLMRISPLGIFTAGRPDEGAAWAREDSRLTHPHPVCQEACAAFVAAVAHAIGSGGTPMEVHGIARTHAGRIEVRQALEAAAAGPPEDYETKMGWVLIALQNAFYQLLHAPSLEEGVVDTVMRGGDTDTNAAICGALLGAVHGRGAVPARWAEAVLACRADPASGTRHTRPAEFWPCDALTLAEQLLTR